LLDIFWIFVRPNPDESHDIFCNILDSYPDKLRDIFFHVLGICPGEIYSIPSDVPDEKRNTCCDILLNAPDASHATSLNAPDCIPYTIRHESFLQRTYRDPAYRTALTRVFSCSFSFQESWAGGEGAADPFQGALVVIP